MFVEFKVGIWVTPMPVKMQLSDPNASAIACPNTSAKDTPVDNDNWTFSEKSWAWWQMTTLTSHVGQYRDIGDTDGSSLKVMLCDNKNGGNDIVTT